MKKSGFSFPKPEESRGNPETWDNPLHNQKSDLHVSVDYDVEPFNKVV